MEFFTQLNPAIFIQGGAVLVALYLIYSHIVKDKQLMKLMTNHFHDDLEQKKYDNESRDKLTSVLQKLIDIINEKIK